MTDTTKERMPENVFEMGNIPGLYVKFSVAFLFVIVRMKSRMLSVSPRKCKATVRELRDMFGIGVPAAASNIMQSVAVILMNQFLLPFGNGKIAAMGIVLKVNMIALLVLTGLTFGG